MEYLTVAKTADLKGCSERYIKKLCKDGKLSCNIEINDRNRPKYMIPISSLPEDLQAKYYAQKRAEAGLELVAQPVKNALKQPKKPVKTSIEEFSEDERDEIALWVDILRDWQRYRDQYPGKKPKWISFTSASVSSSIMISKCRWIYYTASMQPTEIIICRGFVKIEAEPIRVRAVSHRSCGSSFAISIFPKTNLPFRVVTT